jgi:cell wall assembly regulator SMI1
MTVIESGESLTEQVVCELERKLGVAFPPIYRNFLRAYNGGHVNPDTIDILNLPGSPTDIMVLFGIGRPTPMDNIEKNLQMYRGRIPTNVIPIGTDSLGNLFVVSVDDSTADAVSYVDFLYPDGAIYAVAPSIDQMIQNIREFNESTDDV